MMPKTVSLYVKIINTFLSPKMTVPVQRLLQENDAVHALCLHPFSCLAESSQYESVAGSNAQHGGRICSQYSGELL